MSYAARFQRVEVDPYQTLAIRQQRPRKEQWKRLARQSAIAKSGACVAERCDCPNCREHRDVLRRAQTIYAQNPHLTEHDAWDRACYEITDGASETPWSEPE